ncbi:hypothetical protein K461DRAFT_294028 [Myriangium duriaei CBS 260.36]|uniref:ORC6 first cyclin-like domain-containing protein n=1 Tax=Myriangium duriaei CBS 260.36 TaxID=1168546 RepID=A0A9P4MGQ4_9PEZI|nr:hypothetical protein K461DRAFT_294028 [Myriangium duriaei CBS 260.36]
MPTQIEQAFVSLVPTLNTVPPELLNLATALLSQSKAKAPNLKPDEEIGRTYACTHIACERSKTRLGLENFNPKPPCSKPVYTKLYKYLDAQLATPSTPRTQRYVNALTPSSATRTPVSRKRPAQDESPSKPASTTAQDPTTPTHRAEKRARPPSAKALANDIATLTPRRATTTATAPSKAEPHVPGTIPPFVEGMVARLARAFNDPPAASHVRAGFQAVVETRPDISPARMPALLVVLMLFVYGRRRGRGQWETEEFVAYRARGVEAVREVEEGGVQSDEDMLGDIKGFLRAAGEEAWLEMPWFVMVEALGDGDGGRKGGVGKTPLRRGEKHATRPREGDEEGNPAGLVVGLGTMFQDAVDWLSRREEYGEWKEGIMLRIKQEASPKAARTTTNRRTSKEVRTAGF